MSSGDDARGQSVAADVSMPPGPYEQSALRRTLITVEVLSAGPFDPDDLNEVHHAITSGDCSGRWAVTRTEQINSERMAELLMAQGSDPDFFGLQANG